MNPRNIARISTTVNNGVGDMDMICFPATVQDTADFLKEVQAVMRAFQHSGVILNIAAKDGEVHLQTMYLEG
jgi:hypothetical protein